MSNEPSREFANSSETVDESSNARVPKRLTERSLSERILALAATGLKLRDISSLLHIHPLIVKRVLEDNKHA